MSPVAARWMDAARTGAQVDLLLDFKFLLLLTAANGTPVILKDVLGPRLAQPLDAGIRLWDGQPLLGPSKTVRGIAVSLAATILASLALGMGWKIGALVSLTAMAGDLLSSFLKRRMKLPPSSMVIGLDQLPEAALPLLACASLFAFSPADIAAIAATFFVGELAISRILFRLHLRDTPY
jgi:hypothetical protein